MTQLTHPIASAIGLKIAMELDQPLFFYPVPGRECKWEVARVTLLQDNLLEFSVKDADNDRVFGATFDSAGRVLSMSCSSGLPNGTTMEAAAMFCEEARGALEEMVLPQ